ncbi:hypothetical protein [Micromonospora zhanjiangensis]|uniref:Uncharacterized protein n=1 Tax=Micromonospora zhanjiangensis TaxID=1522057 RepID=A0ABV8KW40_9ACTN
MEARVRILYLIALLALIVLGVIVNLPVWQAALVGCAVMLPVAAIDLWTTRRRRAQG